MATKKVSRRKGKTRSATKLPVVKKKAAKKKVTKKKASKGTVRKTFLKSSVKKLGPEHRFTELERKMREVAYVLNGMTLDEIKQLKNIEVAADDEECFVISQEIGEGITIDGIMTSVWIKWLISGTFDDVD